MKTYKIVRFYYPDLNRENRTIQKGLTLDEAQAHCNDDSTKKADLYFDGYTEE